MLGRPTDQLATNSHPIPKRQSTSSSCSAEWQPRHLLTSSGFSTPSSSFVLRTPMAATRSVYSSTRLQSDTRHRCISITPRTSFSMSSERRLPVPRPQRGARAAHWGVSPDPERGAPFLSSNVNRGWPLADRHDPHGLRTLRAGSRPTCSSCRVATESRSAHARGGRPVGEAERGFWHRGRRPPAALTAAWPQVRQPSETVQ